MPRLAFAGLILLLVSALAQATHSAPLVLAVQETPLPGTMGPRVYLPTTLNKILPPYSVSILSSTSMYESPELYVVYGEVQNTSSDPLYSPQIIVTFYDASDTIVGISAGTTLLLHIPPGQISPFRAGIAGISTKVTRYELAVGPPFVIGSSYRPITVLSASIRDNHGPEVVGEIRNDQPIPMSGLRVVITFYDAVGTVIFTDFRYASFLGVLQPGQTVEYTLSMLPTFSYTRFTVQAEGGA